MHIVLLFHQLVRKLFTKRPYFTSCIHSDLTNKFNIIQIKLSFSILYIELVLVLRIESKLFKKGIYQIKHINVVKTLYYNIITNVQCSGPKNRTRSGEVTKYCSKNAPKGCSVISIGQLQKQDLLDSSSKDKSDKTSPRTVLKVVDDGESNPSTEDDCSSFGNSSSNSDSPPPPPTTTAKFKQSPLMRVASFFLRNPPSSRRGNCNNEISSSNEVGKLHQPHSLRCFSFDEISRATNDFHPGKNLVRQRFFFSFCCFEGGLLLFFVPMDGIDRTKLIHT